MSLNDSGPDPFDLNRDHWNDRAEIHVRDTTGFYQIAEFKAGADTLTPIESSEIGDVTGLRVLHLQCHLGLDTLSLARRGAVVTGLDFSDKAIAAARGLASELGIAATFVEGNVYDVRELVAGPFDLVYATWGVFCWLPDVRAWLANAAALLAPGGRIYIAEDHPTASQLEEEAGPDGHPRLVVSEHWRTPPDAPIAYNDAESAVTYTGDPTPISHPECREWVHPLSEFLGGALDAGLDLASFREHDRIPWRRFSDMVPVGGGLWALPPGRRGVPLSFSLIARRRS